MKSKIKIMIMTIMSLFKIKNVIVFESNADYTDNSRSFYEYLINNNYNVKYKIYWFVNDSKKFKKRECKNVRFITMWHDVSHRTFFQWIKYFWIVKNAKYLISSNRALLKLNKKTITLNINHGTPFKNVKGLKVIPKDIDLVLVASDFCGDIIHEQLDIDRNKIIALGNPRNDVMFRQTNTREKLKELQKYDKIIIWLPTFRQMNNRKDSSFEFPLGLPIIYTEKDLIQLNKYLKEKNMAILFKLHPAQDTSFFKTNSTSNIIVIDDDYLIEKDVELCELYKITDAMITDYSGVYYDYLQLDKMIGFAIDDFEEYQREKGFVFDKPLDYMAGEKIKNISELYSFFDDVYNDNDKYKQMRKDMKKLFHNYSDDLSSQRLSTFLKL